MPSIDPVRIRRPIFPGATPSAQRLWEIAIVKRWYDGDRGDEMGISSGILQLYDEQV